MTAEKTVTLILSENVAKELRDHLGQIYLFSGESWWASPVHRDLYNALYVAPPVPLKRKHWWSR